MTQQEKIVEHVSQMVLSIGVKSVRMDDVASSLGMSKRTLYELFGDKEELLYRSLRHLIEKQYSAQFKKHLAQCDNMLETLLLSIKLLSDVGADDVSKRLAFNLKKFYPRIYEKLHQDQAEQSLAGLQYALDRCVEEGYIDPLVDVELMARLFFSSTALFMYDMEMSLPEDVSREEAFGAMVVNFLRGLATVKGLQVIDEILAREPRPKTLKQRRQEREQRENELNGK